MTSPEPETHKYMMTYYGERYVNGTTVEVRGNAYFHDEAKPLGPWEMQNYVRAVIADKAGVIENSVRIDFVFKF